MSVLAKDSRDTADALTQLEAVWGDLRKHLEDNHADQDVIACLERAILYGGTRSERTGTSTATSATPVSIQQWWADAHEHFTELQNALDDSQRALDRLDGPGLEAACQRMHDAAGVDLKAHLSTPDPDLTSELAAATADSHAAARMCLSAAAGSLNNYHGEFAADVDQADEHLTAAQELINKALTHAL